MFGYLYYSVFPIIGEFFGKLGAIASMSRNQFGMLLSSNVSVVGYTNLFTGVYSSFKAYSFGLLGDVINSVLSIMWFNIPLTTPLWCAFLISFAEVFLISSSIKFIRTLF